MQHFLSIDESLLEENEDVRRIILRLQSAANDPEVHRGMILEDMIIEELRKRNAEAMIREGEATDAQKE